MENCEKVAGFEMNLAEWRAFVQEKLGLQRYVADQICQWVYQKKTFDFEQMTNLSKSLRASLPDQIDLTLPRMERRQVSADGTRKYLWRLSDGEFIESVILDHGNHYTACISSQVGCPLRCEFCATGRQGFTRNLTAGEIVSHFTAMEADLGRDINNVVFMGMGEPLLNYDNVIKAVRMLMEPKMRGMGVRRITISTSGIADGIRRLADEGLDIYLCLSLHAPNDEIRSRLMPVNNRYPLGTVLSALEYWQKKSGVRLTIEYVLLKNINDTPECAYEMVTLFENLQVYVNLIPYNPVAGTRFARPSASRIKPFMDILKELGVEAELRREKGTDIDAACGQLRGKAQERQ
ncbi:MAG: 23S rRNA (adenine(2503)-C(2))-methyltransferase RlmN [Pyramidobacter sp.]|nr:23S rRNA (adenine(2503)-C(2))-methyltransferase RlmN [Pyramidobacter sp.]